MNEGDLLSVLWTRRGMESDWRELRDVRLAGACSGGAGFQFGWFPPHSVPQLPQQSSGFKLKEETPSGQ